jgi:hypothetical protein
MGPFTVYDPDPIASLRRRRISTDSQDSGQSLNMMMGRGGNTSSSSSTEDNKYRNQDITSSTLKRDR